MPSALNNLLSRKLKLATAALVFERLWSAAFYAMMVAGLFLLLLLTGLVTCAAIAVSPQIERRQSLFYACVLFISAGCAGAMKPRSCGRICASISNVSSIGTISMSASAG